MILDSEGIMIRIDLTGWVKMDADREALKRARQIRTLDQRQGCRCHILRWMGMAAVALLILVALPVLLCLCF